MNETKNATRHAEIECIEDVIVMCKEKGLNWKHEFSKISVVVTVEPCVMCAAALHDLGVASIVYGCPNDRLELEFIGDLSL